jgi:exonuclease III
VVCADHNVRGINSTAKWNAIRCSIRDAGCEVICLQETKKEFFDSAYLKNFCPAHFDSFAFVPSMGNSGGSVIIWKSSRLSGNVIFQNNYTQSVEFTSNLSACSWIITNVYAPCTPMGKLISSTSCIISLCLLTNFGFSLVTSTLSVGQRT